MAWRFSPCNPCCGCCGIFTPGLSKWRVNVPASFADGIITGIAAQFNGQQDVLLTGGPDLCVVSKGGFGPGVAGVDFNGYSTICSGCAGPPGGTTPGTSAFLFFRAGLQSGVAGQVIQQRCQPFSLSTDPSYIYPTALLEYTLQADGCYFAMVGCAMAATQVLPGGNTAQNISWSQGLWVLDGLDAQAIQIGQTFTLPNRGIDGSGIDTPMVCINGPAGISPYYCTYGPIWTGGFNNAPAEIFLQ